MHADWVMGQAFMQNEGAPPTPLMIMVPAADADVIDTWDCSGMRATGSHDIILRDVFVPDAFAAVNMARGGAKPSQRAHANPIYGMPMLPFLAMSAAIPALGAARGMVKTYQERLATFIRPGADAAAAGKVPAQIRLARARLTVHTAETLIRHAARRLPKVAELPEPEKTSERLALRAEFAHAVALCREAAMILAEGAGTSILMSTEPFQRAMRDIITVSTHMVFDLDIALEQYGRGLLGLPPNTPLN
jgi:alkylation response protein AidB-like acyl-CoA dehydrogenase